MAAKVIGEKKEISLWDQICAEVAATRPPFEPPEDDASSVKTDVIQYDATKHNPVFYGRMFTKVPADSDPFESFDPSTSHPACVGYSLVDKPPPPPSPPSTPLPDPRLCSPREYLEHYIFPVLLPGMVEMLREAKTQRCFERKRTKFNACDFLTEWLYKMNPQYAGDRGDITLLEIPFVKSWLEEHPRPPLPLSLLLSDEEAATIIQSFFRGYLTRRDPEVQELRQWQRELREEGEDISIKVEEFWRKHEPSEEGHDPTQKTSPKGTHKTSSSGSPRGFKKQRASSGISAVTSEVSISIEPPSPQPPQSPDV
ncbi:PREDICTED: IQ domain-containing protein K-like [Branchiostoma belcheri]|uniref:IQ domain-containing protein K-like n=1 Tax=Branchiostoma belcheri TaxID=7741 RepID=A0A6P4ZL60_BRABE|nr:PREDICTED: IQ domain-containing protein K-like [Branchiostoma belcheri]KAI8494983.1 hypothetical protein Bbelb_275880 [Branchiostoma belcheri]